MLRLSVVKLFVKNQERGSPILCREVEIRRCTKTSVSGDYRWLLGQSCPLQAKAWWRKSSSVVTQQLCPGTGRDEDSLPTGWPLKGASESTAFSMMCCAQLCTVPLGPASFSAHLQERAFSKRLRKRAQSSRAQYQ